MRNKILVVDDAQAIAQGIAEALFLEGYVVSTAANGAEAAVLVKATAVDLIVTDMWMPEMNGDALIKFVRARQTTPAIRIIVVSADTNEDTKRRALDAGADLFLTKPFDVEFLIDSIRFILTN